MSATLNQPLTAQSELNGHNPKDALKANANGQDRQLSYVKGDQAVGLNHWTIPDMLAEAVSVHGERDAIAIPAEEIRLSYQEFARKVDRVAAGLLALGLSKGDRLGLWSPNNLEWVLIQFATARVGVVLVTINPAYRLAEVEYALNKSECKALVAARQFKTSRYLKMIAELAPELETARPFQLLAEKLPHLRSVIGIGEIRQPGVIPFSDLEVKSLSDQKLQQRLEGVTATLSPDDPINIQFTSGTTGAPKGATLTHYNIVNNAAFVVGRMNFTARDRLCIPVPLYHCFGMVMGSLACVTKGACMVLPGEAFDAAQTLKAVEAESCTALYGVPTMFVALLEHPELSRFNLASLRTGVMAGAPCPIEIMKKVIAQLNMAEVTICYGMTETSPVSFQSHVDDPLDKRVSTVGRIHPHVEVKIVDEQETIVPIGEQGELWTRGYSVMKGYWADKPKTAEAIVAGGWMRTGDLAILDVEGYCRIVGRLKDMIIRGGENIYPREIEEFLYRHPKIHTVQVFGLPDPKFGEEVCVWVLPHVNAALSEQEIRDFCKDQIAHYKIPKYIRIVDDMPMTVTGKPQKFVMRDQMMELMELDPEYR